MTRRRLPGTCLAPGCVLGSSAYDQAPSLSTGGRIGHLAWCGLRCARLFGAAALVLAGRQLRDSQLEPALSELASVLLVGSTRMLPIGSVR
ncbi:hypothetical protein H4W31_006592 [Plantactinospora soyae]|uniref:Uncharacterized protein n=1 Tax=Plantactinospora soyae TaxID=1544732 RepID=A0A927MAP7_9ACTN|nr:hypothetical protein [Plantactinospora soyae]